MNTQMKDRLLGLHRSDREGRDTYPRGGRVDRRRCGELGRLPPSLSGSLEESSVNKKRTDSLFSR